ncbi:MAG TPA: site-2 protease family protein [bacterium]|nr:site-2 protease family protein [bacterium]HPN80980.1 site-2 protease family protein [bacterium]HPW39263.1 site-2 protease family protein [bacterium]
MPIQWLFDEPLLFIVWVAAVLVALTIHEFSHAAVAVYFGDNTPKLMGRLSLNPLDHLDPLGFLMLMFLGFGWAKPVPINPYNLRNSRVGSALVAAAGPLSNLLAIIIFSLSIRLLASFFAADNLLIYFLFYLVLINFILFVFNLIPLPPLDGSKILFSLIPNRYNEFKYKLSVNGPWILLMIILFDNLSNLNLFSRLFGWSFFILSKFI